MSDSMFGKSVLNSLQAILGIERICHVVDIGANPIDGDPPYKVLLDQQLCKVTGFEPQPAALDKLNQSKSSLETYLPYAVGDGEQHDLRICSASGMTSTLEPKQSALKNFGLFQEFGRVIARERIQTFRLDDIKEIDFLDYLKIDIQGGELAVFQNARIKLLQCAIIHTEVSFVALYEQQPTFAEVDSFLRELGFMPHCFDAIRKWVISPMVVNNEPRRPLNQLLEADVIYCRNFIEPTGVSDDHLRYMGMVAHSCYKSFDLTLKCIQLLESRNAISSGSTSDYLSLFKQSPKL